MIKQILKQIWTQRASNAWLWGELLIASVCLWFIIDYLYVMAYTFTLPLGYDVEHTYKVTMAKISNSSKNYVASESEGEKDVNNLVTVVSRLRAYPGVETVSLSTASCPYNMSNSNGSKLIDTVAVHGNIYRVSPDFFNVFRITDKQGKIESLVEAARQENTYILNASAEDEFMQKGYKVLNTPIKEWNQKEAIRTVRGVCVSTRFDDFTPIYPAYYQCNSEYDLLYDNSVHTEFCLRVTPDADTSGFLTDFRKNIKNQLRLGNIYMLDVAPMSDYRNDYNRSRGYVNDVKTRLAVMFFLLVNIFLGIIGTFWIRTQHRRSELALRVVVGSTKFGLKGLLITEGLLLLAYVILPSLIITYNIANLELIDIWRMPFTIGRFLFTSLITYVLIALMIIGGISLPARQAMKVQPAEALREE